MHWCKIRDTSQMNQTAPRRTANLHGIHEIAAWAGLTRHSFALYFFRLIALSAAVVTLVACTPCDPDVPDTEANREGFERHFGFKAPPDVQDVYYFTDEMGVDVLYQLGFEASPETVARIVGALDLAPTDSEGLLSSLTYEFPWWDEADMQRATFYQKSNPEQDYWWVLWYSETTGRVYYLEYSL
jgi:hypothetical protein